MPIIFRSLFFPILFSLGLTVMGEARGSAAIVLGSYSSPNRAEQVRSSLQERFGQQLRIMEIEINGLTHYRIMGPFEIDIPAQRQQLLSVKTSLVPGAWLLLEQEPTQPVARKAQAAGQKTSRWQPAPDAEATLHPQPFPEEDAGESIATPATPRAVPTLARSRDPIAEVITIAPRDSGGVDASRQPIILAKFDEQDIHMKADGHLDEPVWSQVKGYNSMSVLEPDTLTTPPFSTVTRILYTDEGLYVGIWNEQPLDTLVPRLTKRDEYINRDGNHLTLDTSGEGLYGFWFDVNLGGSLTDGKVLPEMEFSRDWDGAWEGGAALTDDGYTTEYFLPWSMMAMPESGAERRIGFYTSRRVSFMDERWGWPALPMTGSIFMSGLQLLQLEGINPKQQFAFYPFASTTYDNMDAQSRYRTGLDASWRPSPNMQLTATLNPDFGTVESDQVVVNLTAFETFFSEKRLFFLEGNEIFVTSPRSNPFGSSSFQTGSRQTRSFFMPTPTSLVNTRRIGGPPLIPEIPAGVSVSDIELNQPTDLYGAVKITGQQGRFRYGVLAASEEDAKLHGKTDSGEDIRIDQSGRDFGVVRFLYENNEDGRRSIGWMSTAVTHPSRDAFVHGIDGHYRSSNSKWRADGQLMYSDVEGTDGYGGFVDIAYTPHRGLTHTIALDYLDDKLNIDDFGFIRRNDLMSFRYSFNQSISGLKNLRLRTQSFTLSQEHNLDNKPVRSGLFWRNSWTFNNSSMLRTELDYFPKRWDDRNSEGNGSFRIEDRWVAEVGIGTDSSKVLSVSLATGMMQEELGGWTTNVKGGFTYKPFDRLSLDLDLLYQRRDGWLLHQEGRDFTTYKATNWQPQLAFDYLLSARQQLRLTLQWAGIRADEQEFYQVPTGDGDLIQISKTLTEPTDDFAISQIIAQLRYRWEIAPLSDLFVIYNRGSDLVTRRNDTFSGYFKDALIEPLVDVVVIKLRYRFGS